MSYPTPSHKRPHWRRLRRFGGLLLANVTTVTAVLVLVNLGATVAALTLLAGAR
jgi:hypothetical protein